MKARAQAAGASARVTGTAPSAQPVARPAHQPQRPAPTPTRGPGASQPLSQRDDYPVDDGDSIPF